MSAPNTAPRLGVNIDHVATLRELRGTPYPDLLEAARLVELAGAHQITVHLREDRRHIQDDDVKKLRANLRVPLNLEMAATPAMTKFATKVGPEWACLVPEKRQEVTTEGGLALAKNKKRIASTIRVLRKAKIKVSLFVEPSIAAMKLAASLGADAVELHTGRYCGISQKYEIAGGPKLKKQMEDELKRIRDAAEAGLTGGLKVHAGHGFDYVNVRPVAELALIEEYNIGHAIVCRAALVGMERAVREMIAAVAAP